MKVLAILCIVVLIVGIAMAQDFSGKILHYYNIWDGQELNVQIHII